MTSTKTMTRQEIDKRACEIILQLSDAQIDEAMETIKKRLQEEAGKNGEHSKSHRQPR